ncbi:MAG TPA: dienelactone hydrolase family protein [Burkholderiales bacterium]|nr:dienelactone hydrolase family protein [Burkholderiales bacterium]
MNATLGESAVSIPSGPAMLEGVLELPPSPCGIVVFSHGSGSGRHSPRNRSVAQELCRAGLATLLTDLLTPEEDRNYAARFDIGLLTDRLGDAVRFARRQPATRSLPIGLFGASTGAASALRVAAAMPGDVQAVVSRGGRPDLTGDDTLARVRAPTLLIVGARDHGVIGLNRAAHDVLECEKDIAIVRGATHLFEEPGALEEVARLASDWFLRHLAGGDSAIQGVSAGKADRQ